VVRCIEARQRTTGSIDRNDPARVRGAFGQQLFVNRALGLLVVFTANLSSEQASTIFETLIREHVVLRCARPAEFSRRPA